MIDGQDIACVTLESLRRQATLIPQEPLLFHRTLKENIHYGNIDASEKRSIGLPGKPIVMSSSKNAHGIAP